MPETLSHLEFHEAKYYRQCKRCFMTGKACIYQRNISQALRFSDESIVNKGDKGQAFMLMPFRSTIDEVYRAQIEPCLKSVVKEVKRADDVSRTGYVICEKICKQIQESQVICAEISCDNPNVFYELGLSYALDRNISLFIQRTVEDKRSNIKTKLSLTSSHYNLYNPFDMLHASQVNLWKTSQGAPSLSKNDSILVLLADNTSFTEEVNKQVLCYSIDGLCRGAIHRSLAELVNQPDSPWENLKHVTITVTEDNYVENGKSISFKDVEDKIRNSAAIIICTSKDEPCSYFWLGFAHGLEKDVVPITALPPKEQSSSIKILYGQNKENEERDQEGTAIIPFDMRSLWHIYFYCDRPKELEDQIHNILEIIANKDRDTLYRRQFWQPFLDEGSVSIFVGSVELTKNKRHVVGEWDYRTVSELSSFFTSIKETMETVIQTPIFQASTKLINKQEDMNVVKPVDYAADLASQLMSRSSIIIASADVNDMTEVALSTHAGVEPFHSLLWKEPDFDGIVAFKGEEYAAFPTPSLYFQSLSEDDVQGKRGFYDVKGGQVHDQRTYASKYMSYETKCEKGYTEYYGHIAKFKLPNSNHWTVVLQGITGPATLGLAQLLTGGINEQFTIFDQSIAEETRKQIIEEVSNKSASLKESLVENEGRTSLAYMRKHSEKLSKTLVDSVPGGSSVEAIIKIYTMDGGDTHHDERRIIWWDIEMKPRIMAMKKKI